MALKARLSGAGGADVRNTSIMEIMIILVFVTLVMLAEAYGENTRLREETARTEDEIQQRIADLRGTTPEQMREQISRLGLANDQLSDALRAAEAEASQLTSENEALQAAQQADLDLAARVEDLTAQVADGAQAVSFLEAAQQTGLVTSPDTAIEELRDINSSLNRLADGLDIDQSAPVTTLVREAENSVDALQTKNTRLTAQAEVFGTGEEGGRARIVGYVPCWWNPPPPNYDYSYTITMHDSFLQVEPRNHDRWRDFINDNPVMRIPKERLSNREFERWGGPIKRLGDRQPVSCDFVVLLFDRTSTKQIRDRQTVRVSRFFQRFERFGS